MIKPNSEFGYKLLKPLVLCKFKSKYKPTIIGSDNIPLIGPIIVCGNHRHKDDQYNVMMVTKRVIHYMAKEEYFDNHGLTEWFYRFVGCIRVDRSIHDENAKSEAMDILNSGGAVGLFPEGTRNEVSCKEEKLNELYEIVKDKYSKEDLLKLLKNNCFKYTQIELLIDLCDKGKISKDELKEYVLTPEESISMLLDKKIITKEDYDESALLPLKYGAVSLANKTGALILPFGTHGKYNGIKGQLVTKIGKPIDVKGMEYEEANALLRKSILELMQK